MGRGARACRASAWAKRSGPIKQGQPFGGKIIRFGKPKALRETQKRYELKTLRKTCVCWGALRLVTLDYSCRSFGHLAPAEFPFPDRSSLRRGVWERSFRRSG